MELGRNAAAIIEEIGRGNGHAEKKRHRPDERSQQANREPETG
jgi:hypothetical protein